jgi:hypothetical protein
MRIAHVRSATFVTLLVTSLALVGLCAGAGGRTTTPAPPVPYEDYGACPFECCTYRIWTVEADTEVHTDRQDSSPVAFRVRRGEQVVGITGIVVTMKLGRAIVRESIVIELQIPGLMPGSLVYVLSYVGEGAWKIWVGGQIYETEVSGKEEICVGRRGETIACAIQITEEPQTAWWAKVRNSTGQEGWTRQLDHFGNMDACG